MVVLGFMVHGVFELLEPRVAGDREHSLVAFKSFDCQMDV
jgi:hypothetical protein